MRLAGGRQSFGTKFSGKCVQIHLTARQLPVWGQFEHGQKDRKHSCSCANGPDRSLCANCHNVWRKVLHWSLNSHRNLKFEFIWFNGRCKSDFRRFVRGLWDQRRKISFLGLDSDSLWCSLWDCSSLRSSEERHFVSLEPPRVALPLTGSTGNSEFGGLLKAKKLPFSHLGETGKG